MGIVNATPDSFSDGGLCADTRSAVEHALKLADWGADMIDVGGESTRPGSKAVPLELELERVVPVIEGVRRVSDIPISIDTTKSEVARRAVAAGADMINDISAGRFDAGVLRVAAESGVPICLMHMKGTPRDMQVDPTYDDLISEVVCFLREAVGRARAAGIEEGKLLIDPGIGFGKTAEGNLEIIRRLAEIAAVGRPVLIGTSRKSFIGKILDTTVDNRLEGTLATLAAAIDRGARIIRVHDVEGARRFVTMYLACR